MSTLGSEGLGIFKGVGSGTLGSDEAGLRDTLKILANLRSAFCCSSPKAKNGEAGDGSERVATRSLAA